MTPQQGGPDTPSATRSKPSRCASSQEDEGAESHDPLSTSMLSDVVAGSLVALVRRRG